MKRKMQSVLRICLAAFSAVLILSSCTGRPATDETVNDGKLKIRQSSSVSGGLDAGQSLLSDKILSRFSEIEEKYGCKVEVTVASPSAILDYMQTSAAGTVRYADIVYTDTSSVYSLWQGGLLRSMQDMEGIDPDADKWGAAGLRQLLTLQDGKTYGFTNAFWADPLPRISGILYYNEAIILSHGLMSPSELSSSGKWDFEAFTDLCRKVTHDGVFGFTAPSASDPEFIHSAIYANGSSKVLYENGRFVCGYDTSGTVRALEWVRKLVGEEKVSYEGDLTPAEAFKQGLTLFYAADSSAGTDNSDDSVLNTLGQDLRWCAFPSGYTAPEDGTAYYRYGSNVMAITKFADPSLGKVIDALFEPLPGRSADSWKASAGRSLFFHTEDLELYAKMISSAGTDRSVVAADAQDSLDMMLEKVVKGYSTPIEAVEQMQSLVSASLPD